MMTKAKKFLVDSLVTMLAFLVIVAVVLVFLAVWYLDHVRFCL